MAETHVIQWTAAFAGAIWLTARWLLERPRSRWRHIAMGIVCAVLWLPVSYLATNVETADGGTTTAFGSDALAGFGTLMVVVCIAGLLVGLTLWAEESVDEASEQLAGANRRDQPRR